MRYSRLGDSGLLVSKLAFGTMTLGSAWKGLLKLSDTELGIDGEFTRPGIVAMLEQLEDDFGGCEATCEFAFKWR